MNKPAPFRPAHHRAMRKALKWLDAARCDARRSVVVRDELTKASEALQQALNFYASAHIHETGSMPVH